MNGMRFDGCKDSCIPNRTSSAVNADTAIEAPYVTDRPKSDNFPATIAPTKKAHAERAKYIPKTELMRSGFDTEMSAMITCEVIMKSPKFKVFRNLDAQIAITDGFNATTPLTNAMAATEYINAGFRPMESSNDPSAGMVMISVNAEVAARMDRVDVARSDPIASISAGAGEKETKADDATVKKDEVRKTDMSLRVHGASGEDDDGDCVLAEATVVVDLSFVEIFVCPFFVSLLSVGADSAFFLFGAVDPPRTKTDLAVGLFLT